MQRRYYTVESLEQELRRFEEKYGMNSNVFAAVHRAGRAPADVDPFERTVWADTYHTMCRLRADAPTAELQPAG